MNERGDKISIQTGMVLYKENTKNHLNDIIERRRGKNKIPGKSKLIEIIIAFIFVITYFPHFYKGLFYN